jgi:hypothetical protein
MLLKNPKKKRRRSITVHAELSFITLTAKENYVLVSAIFMPCS